MSAGSGSRLGASGSPQDTNSPASLISGHSPLLVRDTIATEVLQSSSGSPHPSLLGEKYGLLHFTLLRHFETQLVRAMGLSSPETEAMIHLTVREALNLPFLMDELLAVSAAHKSTLSEAGLRDYYRIEATRLQTRALTQFNAAMPDISDENCLAVFLFSTFLGQHVLFDTFSSHGDLATVLDKLVQCLSVHRGIAIIAGRSWPAIRKYMPPEFSEEAERQMPAFDADHRGTECARLLELLDRSELSPPSRQACCAAVGALQQMISSQQAVQAPSSRRLIAVQQWPVRVPEGYIALLAQRRPEALVILAYYAVLVHQARDFWVVGDAGRFLIQSISQHLGSYWAEWLEWPNHKLGLSGASGSQASPS